MIDALYSREILRRTTQLQHLGRLDRPQASADRVAKLCGSTIHVELSLSGDTVCDFAMEIEACALGQAAAAILSQAVIGATAAEIRDSRDSLRRLLKGEDVVFPERFQDLSILSAVRDYPPRHASTLLSLEATCDAINTIENRNAVA
ncbi:iron-sulfur cluster assembly scaffold protein [Asticcacaulis solisilvae]|uniref:iron-sulfur cluster assembly scaffold protein n=1 Tax=Asticcacaulis solisilvae TaxID=1217274 RepID=UPI003FD7D0CB